MYILQPLKGTTQPQSQTAAPAQTFARAEPTAITWAAGLCRLLPVRDSDHDLPTYYPCDMSWNIDKKGLALK